MFLRFNLPLKHRVTFTLARVEPIVGVNSLMRDEKHILLWDFDDKTLDEVRYSLRVVQQRFALPDIMIYKTRADESNYHAYCLKLCSWIEAVRIIVDTELVDWGFVKWGIMRGYFTLRVSPKGGCVPYFVVMLPSRQPDDVTWHDFISFAFYETVKKG